MERAGREDTGREQVRNSSVRGRKSGAGWKGSREVTEGKVKYRDQRVKSQEERARRQE